MTITTKVTTKFALSDGREFDTRAEASAAQDLTDRTARVSVLLTSKGVDISMAPTLAGLGKDLIAAMTLPAKMGPKPKAAAPAAAA